MHDPGRCGSTSLRFIVHPPGDDDDAEPADFPSYNPADDIPPY